MSEYGSFSRDVFEHLAGCKLPEWSLLAGAISTKYLTSGAPLFHAGENRPFVYVVNAGVIKMVYETKEGECWVKGFAQSGVCFASLSALDADGVTTFSAYAEVDSCVEQIEYQSLALLASKHLAWQRAVSNAFKIYGQRKERREMELLTLSAEERYLQFLRDCPEIARILRQRDIASYVRVTPVGLSRIRSRLVKKNKP